MIDRGFPLNLNIRDTDGMCYEAVDLAEQGGNPELMNLIREITVREKSYSNDAAFALAIKSGDLKKLKFMIDRGFPLNLNIRDTDGMCYEAVDLAEQGGNPELMNLIREITDKGLPKQTILVFHGDRSEEFIIPNSPEDWKQFRGNVCFVFGIDRKATLSFHLRGDEDKEEMRWHKFREGRKYNVEFKI
eukprot:TRINITY_DN8632_c0_g2_i1.p1 TRINITY_DN8632_c0_g2~~TRINITY_DN8632_c0_g2_i1.p1  ORF type:complete len:189 (+),score=40.52 TRINITY_DN8632_c0_g2_i1:353-919(+)